MTHEQALYQAKTFWGYPGQAYKVPGQKLYKVGIVKGVPHLNGRFIAYGTGKTYEEAFENAAGKGE